MRLFSRKSARETRVQAERWIALEAVDRARNVFRAWRCDIGTDLFGAVTVSVTFGRIGAPGRIIAHTVSDQDTAEKRLRVMLARRASAPRRIGVAYRVTGSCDVEPRATAATAAG